MIWVKYKGIFLKYLNFRVCFFKNCIFSFVFDRTVRLKGKSQQATILIEHSLEIFDRVRTPFPWKMLFNPDYFSRPVFNCIK